jgi:hypothetical protein
VIGPREFCNIKLARSEPDKGPLQEKSSRVGTFLALSLTFIYTILPAASAARSNFLLLFSWLSADRGNARPAKNN